MLDLLDLTWVGGEEKDGGATCKLSWAPTGPEHSFGEFSRTHGGNRLCLK